MSDPGGLFCEIIVNIFKTACCRNGFLSWLFPEYTQSSIILYNWGPRDIIWETTLKLIKTFPPLPPVFDWQKCFSAPILTFVPPLFLLRRHSQHTCHTQNSSYLSTTRVEGTLWKETGMQDWRRKGANEVGGRQSGHQVCGGQKGTRGDDAVKRFFAWSPNGGESWGMKTCLCMQLTPNELTITSWPGSPGQSTGWGRWTLCFTSLMLTWKIEGQLLTSCQNFNVTIQIVSYSPACCCCLHSPRHKLKIYTTELCSVCKRVSVAHG